MNKKVVSINLYGLWVLACIDHTSRVADITRAIDAVTNDGNYEILRSPTQLTDDVDSKTIASLSISVKTVVRGTGTQLNQIDAFHRLIANAEIQALHRDNVENHLYELEQLVSGWLRVLEKTKLFFDDQVMKPQTALQQKFSELFR